jgi:hypothetical protein
MVEDTATLKAAQVKAAEEKRKADAAEAKRKREAAIKAGNEDPTKHTHAYGYIHGDVDPAIVRAARARLAEAKKKEVIAQKKVDDVNVRILQAETDINEAETTNPPAAQYAYDGNAKLAELQNVLRESEEALVVATKEVEDADSEVQDPQLIVDRNENLRLVKSKDEIPKVIKNKDDL